MRENHSRCCPRDTQNTSFPTHTFHKGCCDLAAIEQSGYELLVGKVYINVLVMPFLQVEETHNQRSKVNRERY